MLQISNLNDVKSEWNLNETHIIIPMVEGDIIQNKEADKMAKNTITLNALNGTDQTILTNGVEQTFVIGLDRNIFDNYGGKNDLVFVQNSELKKILPLTSEPKNGITYMVSYTDLSKNEVWDSSILKERSKPDWCLNQTEKQNIFTLNDAVQESSKSWQEECVIEKSNDQIVLEGIDNAELLENQDQISRDETEKETQYLLSYYPQCDTISVLPNTAIINVPKIKLETPVLSEQKNRVEFDVSDNNSINDFIISNTNDISGGKVEEKSRMIDNDTPVINSLSKTDVQAETFQVNSIIDIKENSSFLPEKSLPLKKKAKMKRTPNSTFTLPDVLRVEKDQVPSTSNQDKDNESDSDSDVPLAEQLNKNFKKRKINNEILEKPNNKRVKLKCKNIDSPVKSPKCAKDGNPLMNWIKPDRKQFKTIFEVLEHLKAKKLLTDAVVEILTAGLVEMKTDVLAEMNSICENKSKSYSAQLKAFALTVLFKQPVAFRRLKEIFEDGWPSMEVIKDWKSSLNNSKKSSNRNKSLESEKEET